MTEARRGGDLEEGFDSHEWMAGLSGSSKPTYWKVRLCLGLGYDFLTTARTRANSAGVKESKGWRRWLETGERVQRDKSMKTTSFNVEAMARSVRVE